MFLIKEFFYNAGLEYNFSILDRTMYYSDTKLLVWIYQATGIGGRGYFEIPTWLKIFGKYWRFREKTPFCSGNRGKPELFTLILLDLALI